jgi:isocitrate lyase
MESLVFTLKEGFEFGEMARRTHEHVLAEMPEKVLAYNICQIIRVRKKLSELEEMQRAAAFEDLVSGWFTVWQSQAGKNRRDPASGAALIT